MNAGLLSNIVYGNELERLHSETAQLRGWFAAERCGEPFDWNTIEAVVRGFFERAHEGVFDGPITAGDAIAVAAFMAAVRPSHMLEIGVASGFSSAFIISCAKALGLTTDGDPFLYSFDLVKQTVEGDETGAYFNRSHPDIIKLWKLETEVTSLDLIRRPDEFLPLNVRRGPVIAFIDGGHSHPWPLADIIAMHRLLPHGSWLMMQDSQMMERWIADTVIYQAPCPPAVRGVNLCVALWPGSKQIGGGLNYNTSAICLDASSKDFETFVSRCLSYPDEIEFPEREELWKASLVR